MTYIIETRNETFFCTDEGFLYRKGSCAVSPSPDWKLVRIVHLNNFGAIMESYEFIHSRFKEQITNLQWLYKNGKPRFMICDRDHGTYRMWGQGVRNIRYVED